jgi:hypothetical protein
MILLSDSVRVRGRLVIGAPGPAGSLHADPVTATANNIGPKNFMVAPPYWVEVIK